jgi:transcription elongation GreA/GreB family factor
MQIPQRRSQINRIRDAESLSRELTPESLERLKRTLNTLEKIERPKIVVDLSHALTLGDFSENAEYQDAKHRLSRIDGRIFGLKERIRLAIVIDKGPSESGAVGIGSTVRVRSNGKESVWRVLGSQESNPARGQISYLSPIGSALLTKKPGDIVEVVTPSGTTSYEILSVE